jgi:hypothetical protein
MIFEDREMQSDMPESGVRLPSQIMDCSAATHQTLAPLMLDRHASSRQHFVELEAESSGFGSLQPQKKFCVLKCTENTFTLRRH